LKKKKFKNYIIKNIFLKYNNNGICIILINNKIIRRNNIYIDKLFFKKYKFLKTKFSKQKYFTNSDFNLKKNYNNLKLLKK